MADKTKLEECVEKLIYKIRIKRAGAEDLLQFIDKAQLAYIESMSKDLHEARATSIKVNKFEKMLKKMKDPEKILALKEEYFAPQ